MNLLLFCIVINRVSRCNFCLWDPRLYNVLNAIILVASNKLHLNLNSKEGNIPMKCIQPPLNVQPTHYGKRCGKRTVLRNKCSVLHHTGTRSKKVMACTHFTVDIPLLNRWLLLHTHLLLLLCPFLPSQTRSSHKTPLPNAQPTTPTRN